MCLENIIITPSTDVAHRKITQRMMFEIVIKLKCEICNRNMDMNFEIVQFEFPAFFIQVEAGFAPKKAGIVPQNALNFQNCTLKNSESHPKKPELKLDLMEN